MRINKALINISILALYSSSGKAQTVYNYNTPGCDCYSEMIFEEAKFSPKAVIVLDAGGSDIRTFSRKNELKNSNLFDTYSFLYVNVLNQGRSNLLSCYEVVVNSISSAHRVNLTSFYLLKKNSNESIVIQKPTSFSYHFNIIEFKTENYSTLFNSLERETEGQIYRKPEIQSSGETEREERMMNYKRNFDIGVYFSPLFGLGKKWDMDVGYMGTYGFSMMKNIGKKIALKAGINASIKKPDQSSVQSSLQSKIMTAVQNSEDSVYIDQKIAGHVFLGGEFSFRYYFYQKEKVRLFSSIGIGTSNLTSMKIRIQDTIDISGVDLSNQSSLQDALSSSSINPEDAQNEGIGSPTKYLTPLFEAGLEARLAPAAKFSASIPFRYFIDKSGTDFNTLSFGLNFSLTITLNPGKFRKLLNKK